MADEHVQLSTESEIARIVLNRPDKLNALTQPLLSQLRSAIEEAIARDDVRVISITGAGRAFCSGQDLSERHPDDGPFDLEAIQREMFHPIICAMIECPKPFVTCVNGVAAGAGAGIALAADIVLASNSAKFVFSFSKIGLSVDAGLGRALASAMGVHRAKALLLLGESISASEAEAAGLVWRVAPDAELETEHSTVLERLAASPRHAMSGIKAALSSTYLPLRDYLEIEARLQGRAGAHPDYGEGVLSFLERRPARFS